ncbi:MAG TPA: YiiX/YebB-like N1pC/P60 family cysteine hydrolase, partial [bacterium]
MKTLKSFLILCFIGQVGLSGCKASYQGPLKEGDIVFQDLACSQSEAIKLATHSPYSHVGMILFKREQPYVYEAVGPVKFTSLQDWIKQGEGSHFVARRLKNANMVLTPTVLRKMEEVAKGFKG